MRMLTGVLICSLALPSVSFAEGARTASAAVPAPQFQDFQAIEGNREERREESAEGFNGIHLALAALVAAGGLAAIIAISRRDKFVSR